MIETEETISSIIDIVKPQMSVNWLVNNSGLNQRQRLAIIRFMSGETYKSIGEAMGVSYSRARQIIYKSIRRMTLVAYQFNCELVFHSKIRAFEVKFLGRRLDAWGVL